MPALIRCALFGFILLLFGCSEGELSAGAEHTIFIPDDFVRHDLFNASIQLPDDFENVTPEDEETYYRFVALSKDQYLEIHRISKSDSKKETLKEFAQSRVDQFSGRLKLLKTTAIRALEIKQASALSFACDAIEPGSAHPWAYWMLFVESGPDFYEVRTWTRSDRKLYFEEKANAMLHSFSFTD